ncbi:GNAT family N-acetyltransferase [Amycolatopsis keratiniphila]|uniref:GNAT family N-acetyltransferase n=1 Tax=Amycolatopsis keratiniphila TaxID=129921 RepID=UPI00087CCF77|nr:GNAT family N-acetyltransferase [Amycolatopsis keratiniphila]OLZ58800.1 GNAT family N-acetyltransferase [Amycolatopsis keratiniphila subsp. nogabecina]SDU69826.1 Acetyltransferase (GNAT) family protein [Amycolatopsis keratiniphila]
MDLRVLAYDHPDAVKLLAEAQLELAARYGSEDETPMDAAQFAPPKGLFLAAYLDDVPVACGAWRAHDGPDPLRPGDAEIKRMFVMASARGRGLARALLADLEWTAAEAGRLRMVLETGDKQPEAIALYESSGYREIPGFGYYKDEQGSICYGKSLV